MHKLYSFLSMSLVASTLAACGGGGVETSSPTPTPAPVTPTPPANNAPAAAADVASTLNSQAVTIDVLANDSDADSDALTISSVDTSGISGTATIDGTTIVYTPTENALGEERFTYEISDGEDTAQAEVVVTNAQQIIFAGVVTDNPVANAQVSLILGDETFETIADDSGAYSLSVEIDQDFTDVQIIGTGVDDQSHVALTSHIPSMSNLLSLRDEGYNLTNEQSSVTIISHVSTAYGLLFAQQLTHDDGISNYLDFTQQENFQRVLNLAGFIKLLADNQDYDLPENVTTLSLFSDSSLSTEAVVLDYLDSAGLLDVNGEPTQEFTQLLEEMVQATLEDISLTTSFKDEDVTGKFFATYEVRGEFADYRSGALSFNTDGSGTRSEFGFDFGIALDQTVFNWSLDEGTLVLDYVSGNETVIKSYCRDFTIPIEFGYDVYFEILDMCQAGQVESMELVTRPSQERLSLIQRGTDSNSVALNTNIAMTFTLNPDSEVPTQYQADRKEISQLIYSTAMTSLFTSEAEITDNAWVFDFYSNVSLYVNHRYEDPVENITAVMADLMTFNSDKTVSALLGEFTGQWAYADGDVNIVMDNQSITVRPFHQVGKSMMALVSLTLEGETLYYVSEMTPYEPGVLEQIDLVQDLPNVWNLSTALFSQSCWNGDELSPDCVFSHNFNEDQTMTRVFDVLDNDSNYIFTSRESWEYTWQQQDNLITMKAGLDFGGESYYDRQRQWHILNVSESGTVKVLEYAAITLNDTAGPLSEVTVVPIYPRIQTLVPMDLQEKFPEVWERNPVTESGMSPNKASVLDEFSGTVH